MPAPRLLRSFVVLPLLAFAILAASSTLAPVNDASASSTTKAQRAHAARVHKVHNAARIALRQIGDRYSYGAAGPNRFDCSGLMKYSFKKAGIKLPRTSSAQARKAHRIKKKNLRRGDLMFFTDGGGVYHAAM